ncbi:helix-turn-helix domain-containing protein [Gymnodinialimonas sp. 2305UL16-5]
MAHTELDLRERRVIEVLLHMKTPIAKIAAEIGRHRSSIYREIKRNGFTDTEIPELNGYYSTLAQKAASGRRQRRRKLVRLDAATIALFSGERLTCAIVLETNTVIYADCGMAVIQENARQYLTILTYLAETSPALVGCSPSERDVFRQNDQPECVVDALE